MADPSLYSHVEQGRITILVFYVDDLVLTGEDTTFILKTKVALESEFEMIDMGSLHIFLGLETWQGEQGIFLSQQRYVQELLEAFEMTNCRPMEPNTKLSPCHHFFLGLETWQGEQGIFL